MRINLNPDDITSASGFYAVAFEVFSQALEESIIQHSIDMGAGVVIHYGDRYGMPIWLLDNPFGKLYGVWIEDDNMPS